MSGRMGSRPPARVVRSSKNILLEALYGLRKTLPGKRDSSPSHYFSCKRPANYFTLASCASAGICLPSNLKAGLPGW
jgi:hypothetical protein